MNAEDKVPPPSPLTQAIPAVKHYRDRRMKTHFQQQRTAKKVEIYGGEERKKSNIEI